MHEEFRTRGFNYVRLRKIALRKHGRSEKDEEKQNDMKKGMRNINEKERGGRSEKG